MRTSDFESSEVTDVLGVQPVYLNKLVERKLYGIMPSVRGGKGPGSRRRRLLKCYLCDSETKAEEAKPFRIGTKEEFICLACHTKTVNRRKALDQEGPG